MAPDALLASQETAVWLIVDEAAAILLRFSGNW